jgi:8-amino-7-oxononanoate synthase
MHAATGIVAAAAGARSHLASLGEFLRARLHAAGFDTGRSSTQIVPVLLGANERSLQFANLLCEAGFAVRAIRPPTVPAGTSRLRLSLTAGMSVEILGGLVSEMVRIRERAVPSLWGAACDGDYDRDYGAGHNAARNSATRER